MRDSVNCRVDEVRYFVKIVDVVMVDQVRVDQVGCSPERYPLVLGCEEHVSSLGVFVA